MVLDNWKKNDYMYIAIFIVIDSVVVGDNSVILKTRINQYHSTLCRVFYSLLLVINNEMKIFPYTE